MAVQWFLVCHGIMTLTVVISFLCGQWPIFQNTLIQWIHYFLTFGAYDYFQYFLISKSIALSISMDSFDLGLSRVPLIVSYAGDFIGMVFGSKGTDVILPVESFCCERPNPLLQIIYVAIIGSVYYLIAKSSFIYIPGYYIGEVHKYTSFVAVVIGIILFLLTSFCDPGAVNAQNVSQYISA